MNNIFRIFQKKLKIKIIDETDNGFEQKIEPLVMEIISNKKQKLSGKSIKIIVPVDYKKTAYQYSTIEEKEYYDKYEMDEKRALLVLPTDNKALNYTIILNSDIFEGQQYYSSIPHELTHVFDYTNYFNKYGNVHIQNRELKKENYYFEYYLWSEFNAKKIGLERLQKEFDKENCKIDLVQPCIEFKGDVNREIFHLSKLYHLMHFFARISIYDDGSLTLNSNVYPANFINQTFGDNASVLYTTVSGISTFEEFENEKNFLKYLMFD